MKYTSTQITFTLLAIAAITIDTTPVSAVPVRLNVPLTTWYVNMEGERYNDEINGRGASALWAIANENNIGINGQAGVHIPPNSNEINWNAGMEANGPFKSGWKSSASGHVALDDGKLSQSINSDSRIAVFGGTNVRTSASTSSHIGRVDDGIGVGSNSSISGRFTIPRSAEKNDAEPNDDGVKKNDAEPNNDDAKQKQRAERPRNFELGGGVSISSNASASSSSFKLMRSDNVNSIFQTQKKRVAVDTTLSGSTEGKIVTDGLETESKLENNFFTDLHGSEKTVAGKIHTGALLNGFENHLMTNAFGSTDGTVRSDDGTSVWASTRSSLNGNARVEDSRLVADGRTRHTALVFSGSEEKDRPVTLEDVNPTFNGAAAMDARLDGKNLKALGLVDVEYKNGKQSLDINETYAFPKESKPSPDSSSAQAAPDHSLTGRIRAAGCQLWPLLKECSIIAVKSAAGLTTL
ncbi:hypothetical protein THASP1DRAFT_25605 [Thamnocephalis sphaerospora]|uniref:Uncharacterized protein n=1 Tax=Thamnocephalis sphaerospora TaxID=78915 RepID=A0A4P9XKN0_9FUNG|nr:hypothetical protein THASP1DRAFT_25605 [Thamnocephalis sphaerospora]|eukprot:RKP05991.1 hypothetical protein THASP1DRAFT_25605 [Thamnocephalis sphaerospora]